MRVYVIRDFSSEPVRVLVEGMRELFPEWNGEPLEWDIPGLQPHGGQIARDIVYRPLQNTDHAIALLDMPNANVAWEAGLALGWNKSLRFAYVGSRLPPWTQIGALKNLVLHHLVDVSMTAAVLAPYRWDLPFRRATGGKPATLLLCPGGAEGSALRQVAHRDVPQLGQLPEQGWGLYEVPVLLSPYSRVIWVLAGFPEHSDLIDGAENAANGIIAGLAEAWGIEVVVLRSRAARVVADVQPRELTFRGLSEFRSKLGQILARTPPSPVD